MILQLAAAHQFEATEAVIGGQKFLIIPAEALEGLYRPIAAPPQRVPKPGVKAARKVAAKARRRPSASVAPTAALPAVAPSDATVAGKITALLAKRPMTSGDLLKTLGGGSGTVYTALSAMRKAGAIETREDDADGQRKNYLAAA